MKRAYLLDPENRSKPSENAAKELFLKKGFDLVIDYNNTDPAYIFITFFALTPEVRNQVIEIIRSFHVTFIYSIRFLEKIAGKNSFEISCDELPGGITLGHFLAQLQSAGWTIEP
jgi:hypothetical protein